MANQESNTIFKITDFFTATMQKIIGSSDKFENKVGSMQNKTSAAFDKMSAKAGQFKAANMEAIQGIASEIPGASRALELLSNPYVAAGAAAVAAGGLMFKAASMANEWDSQMAKVNVTLEATPTRLKEVSDQVKSIAMNNANAFMDAPKAFDKLVSGGLDYATAIGTLDPVLKAAKAGFTDVGVTAAAAMGAMNSTGISDATRVMDVLIQTLKSGNAEFVDVANYMPKIVPLANDVGFSFEETGGAFAFFTAQGLKAEQASTTLENTMRALGKTTVKDGFKALKIDIYDSHHKMKPLINIVELLQDKLKNLNPEGKKMALESLGLDSEASLGVSMMLQNTQKLKKILDASENSAGALGKAIDDAQTPMEAWLIIMNQGNGLMVSFGQMLLPTIKKVGKWIISVIDGFKKLYKESSFFRDVLSGIGHTIEWAFKLGFSGITRVWNLLKGVGRVAMWLGEAIGLGGGGFEKMYLKARPTLTYIFQMLEKIGNIAFKIFNLDFVGAFKDIKNFKMPDMKEIRVQQAKEIADLSGKGQKPKSLIKPLDDKKTLGLENFNGGKKGNAKEGSVGGGGTKNITINIQHLLSGVTVNTTTIREGAQNIAKIIQEELLKMSADVSLAAPNN